MAASQGQVRCVMGCSSLGSCRCQPSRGNSAPARCICRVCVIVHSPHRCNQPTDAAMQHHYAEEHRVPDPIRLFFSAMLCVAIDAGGRCCPCAVVRTRRTVSERTPADRRAPGRRRSHRSRPGGRRGHRCAHRYRRKRPDPCTETQAARHAQHLIANGRGRQPSRRQRRHATDGCSVWRHGRQCRACCWTRARHAGCRGPHRQDGNDLCRGSRVTLDIVKLLLAHGIDPNKRYANDLTALMWAAGYGRTT